MNGLVPASTRPVSCFVEGIKGESHRNPPAIPLAKVRRGGQFPPIMDQYETARIEIELAV